LDRRHKVLLGLLLVFKLLDCLTTHYMVGLTRSEPDENGWVYSTIYEQNWYYAFWIQRNIWIGHITTYLMAVGYAALILYARRKTLTLWEKTLGRNSYYRALGLTWDIILAGFTSTMIYAVINNIYNLFLFFSRPV